MKHLFFTLALTLALATGAHAQDAKSNTRNVVLKHILPSQAATLLGATKSATNTDKTTLRLDDKTRTVTLTGSKTAVSNLEKSLRFLDTAPRPIRLDVRLLRLSSTPERTLPEQMTEEDFVKATILGEKTLETANNSLCLTDLGITSLQGQRWSIAISPRQSGSKVVHLRVQLQMDERATVAGPLGATAESKLATALKSERRVRTGETWRIPVHLGTSETGDASVRPLYFIQITPTLH